MAIAKGKKKALLKNLVAAKSKGESAAAEGKESAAVEATESELEGKGGPGYKNLKKFAKK
jgi:hypothetical protein